MAKNKIILANPQFDLGKWYGVQQQDAARIRLNNLRVARENELKANLNAQHHVEEETKRTKRAEEETTRKKNEQAVRDSIVTDAKKRQEKQQDKQAAEKKPQQPVSSKPAPAKPVEFKPFTPTLQEVAAREFVNSKVNDIRNSLDKPYISYEKKLDVFGGYKDETQSEQDIVTLKSNARANSIASGIDYIDPSLSAEENTLYNQVEYERIRGERKAYNLIDSIINREFGAQLAQHEKNLNAARALDAQRAKQAPASTSMYDTSGATQAGAGNYHEQNALAQWEQSGIPRQIEQRRTELSQMLTPNGRLGLVLAQAKKEIGDTKQEAYLKKQVSILQREYDTVSSANDAPFLQRLVGVYDSEKKVAASKLLKAQNELYQHQRNFDDLLKIVNTIGLPQRAEELPKLVRDRLVEFGLYDKIYQKDKSGKTRLTDSWMISGVNQEYLAKVLSEQTGGALLLDVKSELLRQKKEIDRKIELQRFANKGLQTMDDTDKYGADVSLLDASDNIDKALRHIELNEKVREASGFFTTQSAKNVGYGFVEGVKDKDLWTFGAHGLASAMSTFKTVDKYKNTNRLTESEKLQMEAHALEGQSAAQHGDYMKTMGWIAGNSTPMSLKFMAEFMATAGLGASLRAGSTAGLKVASRAAQLAAKKYGYSQARQFVLRQALKFPHLVSRVGADAAYSAILTGAFGSLDIAKGAVQGMHGDIEKGVDDEYKTTNQKSAGEAVFDSASDRFIENLSEMSGAAFTPIISKSLGVIGRGLGKVGSAAVSNKLYNATLLVNKMLASKTAQTIGDVANFAKSLYAQPWVKATGFNGIFEEMGEEIVGSGLRHAVGNGEEMVYRDSAFGGTYQRKASFTEAWNPFTAEGRKQIYTTAASLGLTFGVLTPMGITNYVRAENKYNVAKTKFAQQLIRGGMSKTEALSQIDKLENNLATASEFNLDRAINRYANNLNNEAQYNAYANFVAAMTYRWGVNSSRQQWLEDTQATAIDNAIDRAYEQGYGVEDINMRETFRMSLESAREQLASDLGVNQDDVDETIVRDHGSISNYVQSMLNNGDVKAAENALVYEQNKQVIRGMENRLTDEITQFEQDYSTFVNNNMTADGKLLVATVRVKPNEAKPKDATTEDTAHIDAQEGIVNAEDTSAEKKTRRIFINGKYEQGKDALAMGESGIEKIKAEDIVSVEEIDAQSHLQESIAKHHTDLLRGSEQNEANVVDFRPIGKRIVDLGKTKDGREMYQEYDHNTKTTTVKLVEEGKALSDIIEQYKKESANVVKQGLTSWAKEDLEGYYDALATEMTEGYKDAKTELGAAVKQALEKVTAKQKEELRKALDEQIRVYNTKSTPEQIVDTLFNAPHVLAEAAKHGFHIKTAVYPRVVGLFNAAKRGIISKNDLYAIFGSVKHKVSKTLSKLKFNEKLEVVPVDKNKPVNDGSLGSMGFGLSGAQYDVEAELNAPATPIAPRVYSAHDKARMPFPNSRTMVMFEHHIKDVQDRVNLRLRTGHDYLIKNDKGEYRLYSRVHSYLQHQDHNDEHVKAIIDEIEKLVKVFNNGGVTALHQYVKDNYEHADKTHVLSYITYIKNNIKDVHEVRLAIEGLASMSKPFIKHRALDVGNIIDVLCRDVFRGIKHTYDSWVTVDGRRVRIAEIMTESAFLQYINHAIHLAQEFERRKYKVFTENLVLWGELGTRPDGTPIRVAGEADMFAVDSNGNLIIIDFKTSRHNLFGNITAESPFDRVSEFFKRVDTRYGQVRSTQDQYAQQLSVYAKLATEQILNNEREVENLFIMPWQVAYEREGPLLITRAGNAHDVPGQMNTQEYTLIPLARVSSFATNPLLSHAFGPIRTAPGIEQTDASETVPTTDEVFDDEFTVEVDENAPIQMGMQVALFDELDVIRKTLDGISLDGLPDSFEKESDAIYDHINKVRAKLSTSVSEADVDALGEAVAVIGKQLAILQGKIVKRTEDGVEYVEGVIKKLNLYVSLTKKTPANLHLGKDTKAAKAVEEILKPGRNKTKREVDAILGNSMNAIENAIERMQKHVRTEMRKRRAEYDAMYEETMAAIEKVNRSDNKHVAEVLAQPVLANHIDPEVYGPTVEMIMPQLAQYHRLFKALAEYVEITGETIADDILYNVIAFNKNLPDYISVKIGLLADEIFTKYNDIYLAVRNGNNSVKNIHNQAELTALIEEFNRKKAYLHSKGVVISPIHEGNVGRIEEAVKEIIWQDFGVVEAPTRSEDEPALPVKQHNGFYKSRYNDMAGTEDAQGFDENGNPIEGAVLGDVIGNSDFVEKAKFYLEFKERGGYERPVLKVVYNGVTYEPVVLFTRRDDAGTDAYTRIVSYLQAAKNANCITEITGGLYRTAGVFVIAPEELKIQDSVLKIDNLYDVKFDSTQNQFGVTTKATIDKDGVDVKAYVVQVPLETTEAIEEYNKEAKSATVVYDPEEGIRNYTVLGPYAVSRGRTIHTFSSASEHPMAGQFVYMMKLNYNENPSQTVPVGLYNPYLSKNDAEFILNALLGKHSALAVTQQQDPTASASQVKPSIRSSAVVTVNGKQKELGIPILSFVDMLIPVKGQAHYNALLKYASRPNEIPLYLDTEYVETSGILHIKGSNTKAIFGNSATEFDIRTEAGQKALLILLTSYVSPSLNIRGFAQVRLGNLSNKPNTLDDFLPLAGTNRRSSKNVLAEFVKENGPVRFGDLLVFEEEDFHSNQPGGEKGLTGFAWYLKRGFLTTRFDGIGNPLLSFEDNVSLQARDKNGNPTDVTPSMLPAPSEKTTTTNSNSSGTPTDTQITPEKDPSLPQTTITGNRNIDELTDDELKAEWSAAEQLLLANQPTIEEIDEMYEKDVEAASKMEARLIEAERPWPGRAVHAVRFGYVPQELLINGKVSSEILAKLKTDSITKSIIVNGHAKIEAGVGAEAVIEFIRSSVEKYSHLFDNKSGSTFNEEDKQLLITYFETVSKLDKDTFNMFVDGVYLNKTQHHMPKQAKLNRERAKARAQQILGDAGIVEFTESVVEMLYSGEVVVGRCYVDSIVLSDYADDDVIYHESFHRVAELLMTDEQREAAYTAFRRSNPKFAEYTDEQVREAIADMFMYYMSEQSKVKFSFNLKTMFKSIKTWVNMFKTLGSFKLWWLYRQTRKGKFASIKPSQANIDRFKRIASRGMNYTIANKRYDHIHSMKQYYAYVDFFIHYIVQSSPDFNFGSGKLKLKFSLDEIKNEIYGDSESNDYYLLVTAYDKLDEAGKNAIDEMLEDIETLQQAIADTIQYKLGLKFKVENEIVLDESQSSDTDEDAILKDELDDDVTGENGKVSAGAEAVDGHIKQSVEFSQFTRVSQQVKGLFLSFPKTTRIGSDQRVVMTEFGTIDTLGPKQAVFRALEQLNNSENVVDMMYKIETLATEDMFFKELNRRLTQLGNNVSDSMYATIINQLFVSMRSNKTNFNVVTVDQDHGFNAKIGDINEAHEITSTLSEWSYMISSGRTMLVSVASNGEYVSTMSEAKKNFVRAYNIRIKEILTSAIDGKAIEDKVNNVIYPYGTKEWNAYIIDSLCIGLRMIGINVNPDALYDHIYFNYDGTVTEKIAAFAEKHLSDFDTILITVSAFTRNGAVNADGTLTVGRRHISLNSLWNRTVGTRFLASINVAYKSKYDERMVHGLDGKRLYEQSENNHITDVLVDISSGKFQEDTATDPFIQGEDSGSLLIQNNIKDAKFHTLLGIRVGEIRENDTEFAELDERGLFITRQSILMSGYLAMPTMSDKKTWGYVSGLELILQSVVNNDYDYNGPLYKILPNTLADAILGYIYSERDSIKAVLESGGGDVINFHKGAKIKDRQGNVHTVIQGARFVGLAGIYDGDEFISFHETLDSDGNYVDERANLEKAEKYFFSAPYEEQIDMVKRIVYENALRDMRVAEQLRIIERTDKGYEPHGLDKETLNKIKDSLVPNGSTLPLVAVPAWLNDAAVVAYFMKSTAMQIISNEEVQRLFSGSIAYYKWRYNEQGVLVDCKSDWIKRLGGLISTGSNNAEDFDYNTVQLEDEIVKSEEYDELSSQIRLGMKSDTVVQLMSRGLRVTSLGHNKRAKQIIEEVLQMSEEQLDEKLKEAGIYDNIVQVIDAKVKAFEEAIVTDGAAYVTEDMAYRMMKSVGNMTPGVEKAFMLLKRAAKRPKTVDNILVKKAYNKIKTAWFTPFKYTAFGYRNIDGRAVPYYDKCAYFIVFEATAPERQRNLVRAMKQANVHIALFGSARKVGNTKEISADGDAESIATAMRANVQKQSFSKIRRQFSTNPKHSTELSIGVQVQKVILQSLSAGYTYNVDGEEMLGSELLDTLMGAMKSIVRSRVAEASAEAMSDEFNVKFIEKLRKEVSSRGALLDDLSNLETDKNGELKIPLDAGAIANWIESIIISNVGKDVVDIETFGGALIQRSSWCNGDITKLTDDIYTLNGGKKLRVTNEHSAMEMAVSIDFFEPILKRIGLQNASFAEQRQALIDGGYIGNVPPNIITYRIPTQAISSVHAVTVVDVLDIHSHTVVVPAEFSAITGADFDIDKLFMMTLYNDPQNDYERNINTIMKCYLALAVQQHKQYLVNGSIDTDTSLYNKIYKEFVNTGEAVPMAYPYSTIDTQIQSRLAFKSGMTGIGHFAMNLTNHILTTVYDTQMSCFGSKVMNDEIVSLGVKSDREGNSIYSWCSGGVNVNVDVAKDPKLDALNLSSYTYGLATFLLRVGHGSQALRFVAHPVMKALTKISDSHQSALLNPKSPKYRRIKTEQEEYILSLINEHGGTEYSSLDEYIDSVGENVIEVLARELFFTMMDKDSTMLLDSANTPNRFEFEIGGNTYNYGDLAFLIYYIHNDLKVATDRLTQLVLYTSIDSKNYGKSAIQLFHYKNQYNKLFGSDTFQPFPNIEDLTDKTYINDKVEGVFKVAFDILGKYKIQATAAFLNTLYSVIKDSGYDVDNLNSLVLMQESLLQVMFDEFFFGPNSYTERNGIDVKGLISGPNSIAARLSAIKVMVKSGQVEDNFLLQNLYAGLTKEKNNTLYKFVTMSRSVLKSDEHKKDFRDAWESMLQHPQDSEVHKFARDLVVYAYMVNGRRGMFSLVPSSWRLDTTYGQSYAEFTKNLLKYMQHAEAANLTTKQVVNAFEAGVGNYGLTVNLSRTDRSGKPQFITALSHGMIDRVLVPAVSGNDGKIKCNPRVKPNTPFITVNSSYLNEYEVPVQTTLLYKQVGQITVDGEVIPIYIEQTDPTFKVRGGITVRPYLFTNSPYERLTKLVFANDHMRRQRALMEQQHQIKLDGNNIDAYAATHFFNYPDLFIMGYLHKQAREAREAAAAQQIESPVPVELRTPVEAPAPVEVAQSDELENKPVEVDTSIFDNVANPTMVERFVETEEASVSTESTSRPLSLDEISLLETSTTEFDFMIDIDLDTDFSDESKEQCKL